MTEVLYKNHKDNVISNIDYHIIDSCNLNCKACGHFSPLAPQGSNLVTPERADKEISLLIKVLGGSDKLQRLTITGGEVTLNPHLGDIVKIIRKYYSGEVYLYSNGIKVGELVNIGGILKSCNVRLIVTNYTKLKDNITEIERYLGTPIGRVFRPGDGDEQIYFNTKLLSRDMIADQDEILRCTARKNCVQYKNSKLYLCQYTAHKEYLLKKFPDLKLPSEDDGLDLSMIPSYEVIMNYLTYHISRLCYHCYDCMHDQIQEPWDRSKLELGEWIR